MGMNMGMGPEMGMGMDQMGMAEENFIMKFFHSLPSWGQGVLVAVLVVISAWLIGIFIGKLYASVKYPDPEKPSTINPLIKIGMGAAVVICCVWMVFTFISPSKQAEEVMNSGFEDMGNMENTENEGVPQSGNPEVDLPTVVYP